MLFIGAKVGSPLWSVYLCDRSITIEDLIKLNITKLGKNITVKRFQRFVVEDNSPLNPSGGVATDPAPNSPNPLAGNVELYF